MRKIAAIALGLSLCFTSGAAFAAAPEFGTKDGELACLGLVEIGLMGAQVSQPSNPQVVAAISMAMGFYAGRVSKSDPGATKADITRVVAALTLDEKNAYGNDCLKKAVSLSGPLFGTRPPARP